MSKTIGKSRLSLSTLRPANRSFRPYSKSLRLRRHWKGLSLGPCLEGFQREPTGTQNRGKWMRQAEPANNSVFKEIMSKPGFGTSGRLSVTPSGGVRLGHVTERSETPQRLRLLSYNIQAGIAISKYHHYLTHSWKHVLPYPERVQNLNSIANLISEFDIVGLQEVDAGSLRSGFLNLTEYLGMQARFPYWHDQTNRRWGKLAQHSIGLLSRFRPDQLEEHRLPGMFPGRGALIARYGFGSKSLVVMIVHLALGQRARLQQLAYVRDLLGEHRHVILMGDLNCPADSRELHWFLRETELRRPTDEVHTYPSWRPSRSIDHILVSQSLAIETMEVLNHCYSDHLPVMMEVVLPEGLHLGRMPSRVPHATPLPAAIWGGDSAVVPSRA